MRTNVLRLVVLITILLLASTSSFAHDVEIDGICYNIDKNAKTAEVTYKNSPGSSPYSYSVTIPASVTIDDTVYSVTGIGVQAFWGCSRLTSVTIPNTVTSIGIWAFMHCSGLTSVTIPNSVTNIEERVFSGCSKLPSITIPNSVTGIGEAAFNGCYSLSSVTLSNSLTSIGAGAFYNCSSLTSIDIPNSVKSIGNAAFSGCSSLTSVSLSESLELLIFKLFNDCTSLTSIDIPNSVTCIDQYTFDGCTSLNSISLPNSVTSIRGGAFHGCTSITSFTIPNSVTSIESNPFSGCEKLSSIINESPHFLFENECLYSKEGVLIAALNKVSSITIPDYVTEIGSGAFASTSLSSISIPNSVTSIGSSAFSDCKSLTSITIPESVTSIEDYTFSGCSSLTSIDIPISVTRIERRAFSNCNVLASITIPSSVERIGADAFTNDNCLKEIYSLNPTPPTILYDDDFYFTFTTWQNKNATLYVPEKSVEKYKAAHGWSAFKNISAIVPIEPIVPPSEDEDPRVKIDDVYYNVYTETMTAEVAGSAKVNNKDYYSLTIPSVITHDGKDFTVTSVGDKAFQNDHYLTSIVIPNSVTSIGKMAFEYCLKLTSVNIPESVSSIGMKAFHGSGHLKSVIIPNSIKSIEDYTFENCYDLATVTIPNSVTSIGNGAFASCRGLEKVIISDIVTWCDVCFMDNASNPLFYAEHLYLGDDEITDLIIPDGVMSIGERTFCGFDFKTITIPSSVTSIGSYAFYNRCTEIYSLNPIPPTCSGQYQFLVQSSPSVMVTLYVPEEAVEKYRVAQGWNKFKNILAIGSNSIEQVTSSQPSVLYDLSGKEATAPRPGQIVIKKLGGKTVKYRR